MKMTKPDQSDAVEQKYCRACSYEINFNEPLIDLGEQAISSYFSDKDEDLPTYPLVLGRCSNCGLVQLKHTVKPEKLYTSFYGYRSGINEQMTTHLQGAADYALKFFEEAEYEHLNILDIGCNDGTLLKKFSICKTRNGIDLCSDQFKDFYDKTWNIVKGSFPSEKLRSNNYEIIMSFSMLYDISNVNQFFKEISCILEEKKGIWIAEQSYLPLMLETNSYDTIVHEHLEYYTLEPLVYLAKHNGLKIVDISENNCNGGSIRIAFALESSTRIEKDSLNQYFYNNEPKPYDIISGFKKMEDHLLETKKEFDALTTKYGQLVAIGASTKGNTFLQLIGANRNNILYITDRNPDKHGLHTPKTNIPIVAEERINLMESSYAIVLPWHFKEIIIKREATFIKNGGKLVFFFPTFHIISLEDL